MEPGTYLLFVQAEFTRQNPERKIVTNVYSSSKVDIKPVSTEEIYTSREVFMKMKDFLNRRMLMGKGFKIPDDEEEEEGEDDWEIKY